MAADIVGIMRIRWLFSGVLAFVAATGCAEQGEPGQSPGATWLPPNGPERDAAIERQFRGFDMAMVETGYRFSELYRAGAEENWPYAAYHAEKIGTAIERGLERRPARAASAQTFLTELLPSVQRAIEARDRVRFDESLEALRVGCNGCHVAEQMEFVNVVLPTERLAPIGN